MICQRCWKPYNALTGRHYETNDNRCWDLINSNTNITERSN